jgi:hypothetical protein
VVAVERAMWNWRLRRRHSIQRRRFASEACIRFSFRPPSEATSTFVLACVRAALTIVGNSTDDGSHSREQTVDMLMTRAGDEQAVLLMSVDPVNGKTTLHYAAQKGHLALVTHLLDLGAGTLGGPILAPPV